MVKYYSDFVKPIKKIFRALIKADYKTIELNEWASAAEGEAIVNARRESYFRAHDNAWPPRKRPENPPKGLYWLIVPPDEEILNALKESSLISTLPHDTARFPNTSNPNYFYREDYPYVLGDVIDGKTPIPNSTWSMSFRLWSKGGRLTPSLKLYATVKDQSLILKIEDIDP